MSGYAALNPADYDSDSLGEWRKHKARLGPMKPGSRASTHTGWVEERKLDCTVAIQSFFHPHRVGGEPGRTLSSELFDALHQVEHGLPTSAMSVIATYYIC